MAATTVAGRVGSASGSASGADDSTGLMSRSGSCGSGSGCALTRLVLASGPSASPASWSIFTPLFHHEVSVEPTTLAPLPTIRPNVDSETPVAIRPATKTRATNSTPDPADPMPACSGRPTRAPTQPPAWRRSTDGLKGGLLLASCPRPQKPTMARAAPMHVRTGSGRSRSNSRTTPAPAAMSGIRIRVQPTTVANPTVMSLPTGPRALPQMAKARSTPSVMSPIDHRSAAWRRRIEGAGGGAGARFRGAECAPREVLLRAGVRGATGRRFVVTTVGGRLPLVPPRPWDTLFGTRTYVRYATRHVAALEVGGGRGGRHALP